jgi:hypothetical protein
VDGPVVAQGGELPCAVERVDDPHPVRVQPRQVVDGLFRQHRVVGAGPRQPVEDQGVRSGVPGVAEVVGIPEALLLSHLEEEFTGVAGQFGGQRCVGQGHSKQYCRIMRW